MRPQRHLLCGAILCMSSILCDDSEMALGCLIGSVMPDVDHILEYAKYCVDFNVEPSFGEFSSGKYFGKKGTIYVIFHSWEAAVMGLILEGFMGSGRCSRILKGLALGYASHLILDQIGNDMSGLGYFWLFRWWKEWKQRELLIDKEKKM